MKKKIFLADDSITIQKVVELTFSEGDYEVACVGSGAAAMQRLSAEPPDIALLDVIMPDRNGYEVCAQMKKDKDLSWVPVLLLTGAFEPYDERRAREAGADGHITKPFESRALIAAVEGLLASHPRPGAAVPRVERAAMEAASPARPAAQPAPPPPVAAPAQTQRMKPPEPRAPFAPASAPAPAPQPPQAARPSHAAPPPPQAAPPASNGGTRAVNVPPETIERAVREVVAGISEKIVREVAWEVIPDLAEAIIRRRIRELEEEAER